MNTILSLYKQRFDPARPCLRRIDSHLEPERVAFGTLDAYASRAAFLLRDSGCQKGDRVLISLQNSIDIRSVFLGALKCGAVPCMLFPGLGKTGLTVRLQTARAAFFVTDLPAEKTAGMTEALPTLKAVINWERAASSVPFPDVEVNENDPAFIVFTSGTTGTPKPVLHLHRIAAPIVRSMENVLGISPDEVYWCTAHPAWITGTVYGILGPLLCGVESVCYDGAFHAKRWLPILRDQGVTLWYTAPTALRSLRAAPEDLLRSFEFPALRRIFSIGEPLSPALFAWGQENFGLEICDTWFQTETGTIRIANLPGQPIRPGRMGRPVDDAEVRIAEDGRLMFLPGWDSCFAGYDGMPDETAARFAGGLYDTGDLVRADADGCLRFEGRADDVINTSGHLVGPLEVEQVLQQFSGIAEAAVIALKDELLYEKVAAVIVLRDGSEWDRALESRMRVAVNEAVSAYAVPRTFIPVTELPHTLSGKIDRKELRKRLEAEDAGQL